VPLYDLRETLTKSSIAICANTFRVLKPRDPFVPTYEWIDEKGNIATTEAYDVPPNKKNKWTRVFSFGVSSIVGAGGSPSRHSLKRESSP